MLIRINLAFCCLFALLHAESIKSTAGNIIFDINYDGSTEAILNSTGLALGDGLSPSANLHLQGNGIMVGELVVGGTTGNSTLEVQGTIGYEQQTVSSNTTLSGNSMVLVDTSSDNITLTLPYAANVMGREYQIKKVSTLNTIRLGGGGNNIDESEYYDFSSGNMAHINLVSDGSKWLIMEKSSTGITPYTQTLYVYDGFNYAEGNLDTNNGGIGFADAWYASTSSGN